jgi:hypothetical protein
MHCWQQVVFLWKRGIGNMFSSCFLRKHQRNGIRAYQKRKARGLFLKETLAKHVSLMLFPWKTGLGASSDVLFNNGFVVIIILCYYAAQFTNEISSGMMAIPYDQLTAQGYDLPSQLGINVLTCVGPVPRRMVSFVDK